MNSPSTQDCEIALKLELTPGDAARVLDHPFVLAAAMGPAEHQRLKSVYFDSRELALARSGLALRLSRSGDEQKQAVESGNSCVAGLCSRTMIEVEITGERPDLAAFPDESLRARLLDLLGGRPLEPIFELDLERTELRLHDASTDLRLSLDQGELRAGSASELISEVELGRLHGGAVVDLYDVALVLFAGVSLWPGTRSHVQRGYDLHTGNRPGPAQAETPELPRHATLEQALQPIALGCLAQISRNAGPAWDGIDPEGVHEMRVGVRRMRSLLTLLRPALRASRLRRLRDPLRWLAELLGHVRDLDVFIDTHVRPHVVEGGQDVAMRRLLDEAVAAREKHRRRLRKALRSRRYARLILELGRWIAQSDEPDPTDAQPAEPLEQSALDFAEVALSRLHRKTGKLAGHAIAGEPEARHRWRIALKKLRYACEFFQSPYDPKDTRPYLHRLARLQHLLGVLNDLETARAIMQRLLDRCEPEHAVELARAAGFVDGFAAREHGRALRKLPVRWDRFDHTPQFWLREGLDRRAGPRRSESAIR